LTLDWSIIDLLIRMALEEDIGSGDITTRALIPPTLVGSARIVAHKGGVLAGLDVAARVFSLHDPALKFEKRKADGEQVRPDEILALVSGKVASILTAERTALNFLMHLSGVATQTALFVEAVKDLPVKILDTRKTTPGLRLLEKYAVSVGGGTNHRQGLYDMFLIKENHLAALAQEYGPENLVKEAVARARSVAAPGIMIEIETQDLSQVEQAVEAGADIIMLDNMTVEQMVEAVKLVACRAKLEASGGVDMRRLRQVAVTGVDYVSVGALTHSASALDISLETG